MSSFDEINNLIKKKPCNIEQIADILQNNEFSKEKLMRFAIQAAESHRQPETGKAFV